jgi:cellulose biosynthesis protein BcsQ
VSVIYDTFRRIDQQREQNRPTDGANLRLVQSRESRNIMMSRARGRSFKVLTVSSNKGGVGKSTISSNLAVYFRALREDLPILIFGLDDQSILDRMFCLDDQDHDQTVATGLRTGDFSSVIRLGQYGVHYIPSAPNASDLKSEIQNPLCVLETLQRTNWNGVVIIDTKSDLEILTRNAVAASDLVLIPVKNDTSLREARKVFGILDEWSWPRDRARIVLSMLDRRIKYRDGDDLDVLSLLLRQIRKEGFPLLESFISGSPKIESLSTNPEGRMMSILHGAPNSIVHRQMHHVAEELLKALDQVSLTSADATGPVEVPPATPEELEPEPAVFSDVDVTPDECRDAFREARNLIDRWKRQSATRNPLSSRSLWRRGRTAFDLAETGTK